MKTRTLTARLAVGGVVLFLSLTGCAGTGADPAATPIAAADSVSVTDAWVKAADTGMSAAFGIVENSGTTDITVLSADSPAAGTLELHETVPSDTGNMVMQKKQEGFVVPAGGTLELAPGGDHIMLMALTGPIKAGDEIRVILALSDGSTHEYTAVAKDYSGANETYTGAKTMESKTK